MKLKNLFAAIVAGAALLVGCQQQEVELGPAKISVDPAELVFTEAEGSASVTILATRDWKVNGVPDWIGLSQQSGEASPKSQTITLSVDANTGNDREAELVFNIGYGKARLSVVQPGPEGKVDNGDGSKEKPFNVAGILEYTRALGNNEVSDKELFFQGTISSVKTTFEASGTYGNASFYIVDENSTEQFYVFQTYYLGNRQWKAGDEDVKEGDKVIICGKVTNYNGNTPETVGKGGSFVYSLNGATEGGEPAPEGKAKGEGTLENPYNPQGAADYTKSLGSDVESPSAVYIKGKISSVQTTYAASGTYGNATFHLVDAEDGSGDFYVFQTYYLTNRKWQSGDADVKVGDEVIVCGKVIYFKGSTPETVGKGGSYVYSLNGYTDPADISGEDPGPGGDTDIKVVTIAEFLAAEVSATQWYELTGTVSNIKSTVYGNFDLTDASGTVYVYGLTATKVDKNDKSFESLGIKEGDTITIITLRAEYNGSPQAGGNTPAYIKDGSNPGDNPGDDPADVKTVTVAEFNAAAESTTQKYKLTGTISGTLNETYGNFDLVDETGTVYVYGLTATDLGYGTKNDKSFSSLGLAVGDKITIIGYRGSYNDKIEVVYAYFVSKEGGDNPGDDPQAEDVKVVSVEEFKAAPESDTQKYQLTGTIGGTINTTYGNFDLTDESGSVYVYGLTATELGYGAKNDKSYASLNLAEGDKITIIGYRGSYGDKIEVMYAYFVSKE
ncbi:MAG: BACON domain-containing protein [Bacteroidales bacterium]|nr:BACON domain-containing protein [Bacteroidales bacterium]